MTFLIGRIVGGEDSFGKNPGEVGEAPEQVDLLIRHAIESQNGHLLKQDEETFCAVFQLARRAVLAAYKIQQLMGSCMALDSGDIVLREQNYSGRPLLRAPEFLALVPGRRILLTQVTQELVKNSLPGGFAMRDMGIFSLQNETESVRAFELVHPDLPDTVVPVRTSQVFANQLPLESTSFVGREREIAEAIQLLKTTRLLSLTGPGGVGKTRLALKVAANVAGEYPDGVWLVELASLSDGSLVSQSVAKTLGVPEEVSQPIIRTLVGYLRSKKLLLLLDNCEHLRNECAEIVAKFLQECAYVSILTTSQEKLNVAGEISWSVPPLAVPASEENLSAKSLKGFEAVRLFLDRAQASLYTFKLTERNAPLVALICRRLEGIALAIELVAARVRDMAVEQIAASLLHGFELLSAGSDSPVSRHQTLWKAIDWSVNLLSREEQILLWRLSIFRGGFSMEGAQRVCGGEGVKENQILDILSGLADKSLLLTNKREEEARYRILEPLREYGMEKLLRSGETDWITEKYKDYFMSLAEEAESRLSGAEQASWLNRLEEEQDNFRNATDLCTPLEGLRMAVALFDFWVVRGCFTEGRERLDSFLFRTENAEAAQLRARSLYAAGDLAILQGDFALSRPLLEESLHLFQQTQDKKGCAMALRRIGYVCSWQGNLQEYQDLTEKSLAIFRELQDDPGIARCLNDLGNNAWHRGDSESALSLFEQGLAISQRINDKEYAGILLRNIGNMHLEKGNHQEARFNFEKSLAISRELQDKRQIALVLGDLGNIAIEQGEHHVARASIEEGLRIFRQLKDKCYVSYTLKDLAELERKEGRLNRAACLLATADSLRKAINAPLPSALVPQHNQLIAELREGLGDQAFEECWAEGQKLDFETAIEYALAICGSSHEQGGSHAPA